MSQDRRRIDNATNAPPVGDLRNDHVPMQRDGECRDGYASLRSIGGDQGQGPIRIIVDGQELWAFPGESVAAVLLAHGVRTLRWTRRGEPRGMFCGMGTCFDCAMQIDGKPNVLACQTPVREGLHVQTQQGIGSWEPASS
jgi:hypothetical protein